MVTLPDEVQKIISIIEDAGFEAYVVGGSIRDTLLGGQPTDWDIASSASVEKIVELFPHAVTVGMKYGIVKITEGTVTVDAATFRIDGRYTDFRRPDDVIYTDKIEEDLKRRDFTINAMAYNKERGLIDPYGGRTDLKAELIKTVGDPVERFKEDPLRILRGVRFAVQLDFNIQADTLNAMKEKSYLLDKISIDRIREEFLKIVTSKYCGKGLSLCKTIGALPFTFDVSIGKDLEKLEYLTFIELIQNIDKTISTIENRLGLIYLCFKKEKSLNAIKKMRYSNELYEKLESAQYYLMDLEAVDNRVDLKRFINKHGAEMYGFLEKLLEQRQILGKRSNELLEIKNKDDSRLFNRITDYKEMKSQKEPIFIEDLAINGDDLIKLGIKEGKSIGIMLNLLLEKVHQNPEFNNKNDLIDLAKELIQ